MHSSDFYRNYYGAMAIGASQQKYVSVQKGNGFFGRVIRGSILPIIRSVLPYIKNIALDGVGGLIDELKVGKSLKEASVNQLKRTSDYVVQDVAKKFQSGSGVKRKRQAGSGLKRNKRDEGIRQIKRKRAVAPSGLFKV